MSHALLHCPIRIEARRTPVVGAAVLGFLFPPAAGIVVGVIVAVVVYGPQTTTVEGA